MTSNQEDNDIGENENANDMNVNLNNKTIPSILDRTFFKIVRTESENVQGECKRRIKGRIGSTTNFLNHLKTKGHSIQEYKEYKNKQSKNPRKRPYNIDNNNVQRGVPGITITTMQKKQRQFPLSVSSAFSRNSQQVADDLITSFVVETMSPMDIVEHQAFKNFICVNKLTNSVTVMTRKTLQSKMDTKYTAMLQHLTETLERTKYVCATADIWSSSKRSFLGITAHWINASFPRENAALACRRFKGKHSYDRIAEMIHDIHCEFKLDAKKIVKVTTDNASNMVKAFSMFSQNNQTIWITTTMMIQMMISLYKA
ncbi:uncharacterized protein [Polyergus mexicanus]|uniref:uncharacterized protein isoform X1 n=1 Tax=Polyergus mexicanus TaxID=615972 RepID=UPI0038B5C5F4